MVVRQRNLCFLVFWTLTLRSAAASAQTAGHSEVFLSFGDDKQAISFLSVGETTKSNSAGMDYGNFASELVAFVAKEILPDSHDEYPESPLGSHLSRDMTERSSAFGKHCLIAVSQLGAVLPSFSSVPSSTLESPSGLDYLPRVASTALALHQIWSAFKNDVEDNRRGVSLNPKVGAHRIGVTLTIHW